MRLTIVATDLPHPEGTAVGRCLWAWCEGTRALGHDLEVWVWHKSRYSPDGPWPEWCVFEPLESRRWPTWREHLYSLFRPRMAVARAAWHPPEDGFVVADEAASSPAVEGLANSATAIHYSPVADAIALRSFRLSLVQDVRAETRAARKTGVVLAHSPRVARYLWPGARFFPVGIPLPAEPLAPVDAPVAALMADWSFAPNQAALAHLLAAWPSVRDAVPAAQLLLFGRAMPEDAIGTLAGVRFVGPVGRSADILAQASVLAFPCPGSSGPKIKVLEALSYGLPVVTSRYGVEGLLLKPGEGAVVAEPRNFAQALAEVLLSPERRDALARSGRAAVEAHHAPIPASQARLDILTETLGALA